MANKLPKDFAVFILSHGRPDRIHTLEGLKIGNYTGQYFIVIDNEDKTADEYRKRYGDKVVMFDKPAIAKTFDEGDNFNDRRAVIYARNACFSIAKKLGIKYFLQLDDDYVKGFSYRANADFEYVDHNSSNVVKSLDKLFALALAYYRSTNATSMAFAQTGDYLGGENGEFQHSLTRRRKAMNSFFCSTDRPFQFVGRINEDVNTYTSLQNRGHLFFTFALVSIQQKQTQSNKGGMTELYQDSGTYIKSFYTVMYLPSAVRCEAMHSENARIHHRIEWRNAVPCIIPESYRKGGKAATKAKRRVTI